MAAWMVGASGLLMFTLGGLHLLLTFFGRRLHPRDPQLTERMQAVSPRLTGRTSMWRAWIGFNASHSMGAMLFGLIYGYFAGLQAALLFDSAYLQVLGLLFLASWVALGWRYWFRIPLAGTLIATTLYLGGLVLAAAAP